ncbi:hypothetical protein VNO78_20907 [Psophocarpus tetragonolobus]|uniref:Membrane magnesium transporter n=1 Tax=Psophocarpus tetragonolobus TaxID=3891 RepID=A0AAN9XHX4_PSOTE
MSDTLNDSLILLETSDLSVVVSSPSTITNVVHRTQQTMGLGSIIGFLGVLILSHAAYSTIQYRGLLKITEEEFSGPPLNVVIEVLLGLVFCMWAALTVSGKFLSIHPHSEENRVVSLPANLDFMTFNHRYKVFSLEMDVKLKH